MHHLSYIYLEFGNIFVFVSLFCSSYIVVTSGFGIFEANALQVGVDYLDFPTSEVVSSFVRWYYWASYAFVDLSDILG